jgi:uncharacterized protein YdeI (YjbR/CyaY-like superfamily)
LVKATKKMNPIPNPLVEEYLNNGCMRCKFGGTPSCKVHLWPKELDLLRRIALDTNLKEEIKWGIPVYTHRGKNIISVSAMKDAAILGFFKGALLKDKYQVLHQQGRIQLGRIMRFTQLETIKEQEILLKEYIQEAIHIEESGQKIIPSTNAEPIPIELEHVFQQDPLLKKAFFSLTPGRQRGYVLHFSQPKQSETRRKRIEKYKEQIMNGIGLHDR